MGVWVDLFFSDRTFPITQTDGHLIQTFASQATITHLDRYGLKFRNEHANNRKPKTRNIRRRNIDHNHIVTIV